MVKHTLVTEHVLAYFVSCITMGEPPIGMGNEIPCINLYNVGGNMDWYDELLLFLESGTFLEGLSKD